MLQHTVLVLFVASPFGDDAQADDDEVLLMMLLLILLSWGARTKPMLQLLYGIVYTDYGELLYLVWIRPLESRNERLLLWCFVHVTWLLLPPLAGLI
eukprot:scaffold301_cov204-Alexandrium_tamarense.AAC.2